MEPQPALVWAHGRVELNPEAAIDMDLILIVGPRDAEDDLTLGFADPFDQCIVQILRVFGDHAAKAFQHFADSLMEFSLARVAADDFVIDRGQFVIDLRH